MDNKQKYHQLCNSEPTIPVFSKAWWLDTVCGIDNWAVLLFEKNDEILGALPFTWVTNNRYKHISQPLLTQNNGIWIKYPDPQPYGKRLSYEKEVMGSLITQLELLDISTYRQRFHYSFTNWLPFYWQGYSQTTFYTYVIDDISDLSRVEENFSYAKKKNILRAEKIIEVKFDLSAEEFYNNHKATLLKQGQEIIYRFEDFIRIYDAVYSRNAGRTIYGTDQDGNLHSALFVIWDEMSGYDLISTIDPDFRDSGSATLLVREIIRFLNGKTQKFDFEGSMIENVENSFRQFGAVQKPYFLISKTFSPRLKMKENFNEFRGNLKLWLNSRKNYKFR
ncbi:MAG: methicillin resistance protein [Bacteroidetes bacterium]|nr:methicillin resistance protein [Bacteroidota bacterium]